MKRKPFILFLILSFTVVLISCKEKKADLVATFYPHYDILNNIAKDKLETKLIVPFGSEVHGYSPSPKDIEMINNSKLFVYASDTLDVWINDLVNTDINYINMFNEIEVEFESDIGAKVHYWTDPFVFIDMINVLKNEIIKIDQANEDFYTKNANDYINEILAINDELTSFLETTTKEKQLYFAGHNALGGFSYRYNITITPLIEHFSPEAEQTIKQIENIITSLKETNTQYLFIEELVEPKLAETIKRELQKDNLNITLLELHGFHNITADQAKRGITYANLFQQNTTNIKKALN